MVWEQAFLYAVLLKEFTVLLKVNYSVIVSKVLLPTRNMDKTLRFVCYIWKVFSEKAQFPGWTRALPQTLVSLAVCFCCCTWCVHHNYSCVDLYSILFLCIFLNWTFWGIIYVALLFIYLFFTTQNHNIFSLYIFNTDEILKTD